jgi:hypothetical protein
MTDINNMTHEEKVFLAGCIKTIIVVDNNIEENELGNLDKTIKGLKFDDFDDCLTEFESQVSDIDSFFDKASTITKPETRDTILQIVYKFILSDGIPEKSEGDIFDKLKKLWD